MEEPRVLTFDNVRPSSLTLADLLAGTVRVSLYAADENVSVIEELSLQESGEEPLPAA